MTDLTAFSYDSFNSTQWINSVLKDIPTDDSFESFISSLSMKLHIMSQDYTDQLETAMVESMSTMPRMLSEISRIEQQLQSTQTEMKSVSEQLNSFDQRNVSGVEDLSRLDMLKSNMEKCKSTLEEHARWSQLVRETKSLLDSGTLTRAADKIEVMFRSLDILRNLPGHEERQEICTHFNTALLTSLRPKIKRDVAESDVTLLQEYLYVLRKLGRQVELEEEYVATRTLALTNEWNRTHFQDKSGVEVVRFVSQYLMHVVRLIADEDEPVSQLFEERGPSLLCDILQRAVSPLHPSLTSVLSSIGDPQASLDIFLAVDDFVRKVAPLVERVDPQKASETLSAVFQSVYEYLPAHADCEDADLRRQVNQLLDTVVLRGAVDSDEYDQNTDADAVLFGSDGREDSAEQVSLVSERLTNAADAFFLPFESAMRRSAKLAGGVRIKQVLKTLLTALAGLTKQLAGRIDDLGAACGVARLANACDTPGNHNHLADKLAHLLSSGDLDSRVLLTSAFRALQAVGRFQKRHVAAEALTMSLLTDLHTSLFQTAIAGGSSRVAALVLQDASAAVELRTFLVSMTSTQQHVAHNLFSSVLSSPVVRLKASACHFLLGLCTAVPERTFSSLVPDECWAGTGHTSTDTLLPQGAVTQVGEHMLSLVQEFELFAASDALADLQEMKGLSSGLVHRSAGWQSLKVACENTKEEALEQLCRRSSCSSTVSAAEDILFESPHHVASKETEADESPVLVFVNEWLSSVADCVVGLVAAQVVRVSVLGVGGVAQLQADLEYLANVVDAMGIRCHPLLCHIQALLQCVSSIAHIDRVIDNTLATHISPNLRLLLRFDQLLVKAIIRAAQ